MTPAEFIEKRDFSTWERRHFMNQIRTVHGMRGPVKEVGTTVENTGTVEYYDSVMAEVKEYIRMYC